MGSKLEGVIIPVVTALKENGNFDESSQVKLLDYVADNGADAVLSLGLTGEAQYLPFNERLKVMRVTAETVQAIKRQGTKLKLVLGINGNGNHYGEIIKNAYHASKFPIDGVVLQLSRIPDAIDYAVLLEDIRKVSEIPIYLYANPQTAVNNREIITPDTIEEFSLMENVWGIKVSDEYEMLQKYCEATEEADFGVYIGNAMDMFRAFGNGVQLRKPPIGVITGPGNAFPEEWARAWELRNNTGEERERLFSLFTRFRDLYYSMPGGKDTIAAIKFTLYEGGILDSPQCAGKNLSKEDKKYLSKGLEEL
jgi:dihydrodipicolinate synthase/N-acetylneuraminate lyase